MESNFSPPIQVAARLFEVVPEIMRAIRLEMRHQRGFDLSVPQFRALIFVGSSPGTGLSDIAEALGLGLSAMSKMMDGLVQRGLVERQDNPSDRRQVALTLTPEGEKLVIAARRCTQELLAQKLSGLSAGELSIVEGAMEILKKVFLTG